MSDMMKIVINPVTLALAYSVYKNPHFTQQYGTTTGVLMHVGEAVASGVVSALFRKAITLQDCSALVTKNFAAVVGIAGMVAGFMGADYAIKHFGQQFAKTAAVQRVEGTKNTMASISPIVPSKDGRAVYASLPKHSK